MRAARLIHWVKVYLDNLREPPRTRPLGKLALSVGSEHLVEIRGKKAKIKMVKKRKPRYDNGFDAMAEGLF